MLVLDKRSLTSTTRDKRSDIQVHNRVFPNFALIVVVNTN